MSTNKLDTDNQQPSNQPNTILAAQERENKILKEQLGLWSLLKNIGEFVYNTLATFIKGVFTARRESAPTLGNPNAAQKKNGITEKPRAPSKQVSTPKLSRSAEPHHKRKIKEPRERSEGAKDSRQERLNHMKKIAEKLELEEPSKPAQPSFLDNLSRDIPRVDPLPSVNQNEDHGHNEHIRGDTRSWAQEPSQDNQLQGNSTPNTSNRESTEHKYSSEPQQPEPVKVEEKEKLANVESNNHDGAHPLAKNENDRRLDNAAQKLIQDRIHHIETQKYKQDRTLTNTQQLGIYGPTGDKPEHKRWNEDKNKHGYQGNNKAGKRGGRY